MRIFHIAPTRNSENSAAWRILRAQQDAGLDASSLVHLAPTADVSATFYPDAPFPKIPFRLVSKSNALVSRLALKRAHDLPWSSNLFAPPTHKRLGRIEHDILNLHWLPSTISSKSLISEATPIVLTLHDVWPMTGGCHCNLECSNWVDGCHQCPQNPSWIRLSPRPSSQWRGNKSTFAQIRNLSIVAPSRWIANMAALSPQFIGRKISHIPNCINGEEFPITDQNEARSKLGIKFSGRLILFVVSGDLGIYHKGFDLFKDSLARLRGLLFGEDISVLFVGNDEAVKQELQTLAFPSISLGPITSSAKMALVYSASDVIVSASRQDNLPSTLIEASLAGIPIVGFDVGGISEIIEFLEIGRLVDAFDTQELALAINENLLAPVTFQKRLNARRISETKYSPARCAALYRKHYEEVSYLDKS